MVIERFKYYYDHLWASQQQTSAVGGVSLGGAGAGGPVGLGIVGAGPGAAPPTADPEKRKLIQQQLVLLLHAHKCQRREQANGEVRHCNLPHCRTMKNVLNHMTHCQAGKSCQVAHCASSRQIISHWKNCTRHDCPVCLPLKNAGDKRNQQSLLSSAGLVNSLGPGVPGGQPSAPNLNPPSQIDPSSIERAYAALGLTYQGNQMPQQGPPQSNMANQALSGQPGMRSLNNMSGNPMGVNGGVGVQPPNQQSNMLPDALLHSSISLMNDGVGSLGSMPMATPPSAAGMRKSWHEDFTQDLRNHLVHKLVQAIFPTPDPAALKDRRMENLEAYTRKVEGDMYESANSRAEYYHLLAEKIYKIQNELEEKRRTRLQKQGMMPNQPGMPPSGLPQVPPGMGQPQMGAGPPQNGPLSDPSMVRPVGPNHMVNRMQKMEKLGLGLDDESHNAAAAATQSPGDSRRLSIQRGIQSLVHACQCRNANCSLPSCQKMKRVVQHTKGCKRKTNGGCPICKQLIALCCYHAKHCKENKCPVLFCLNIKHKLRQQQLQHRLQQAQMLRSRMASMQRVGQPTGGPGAPVGMVGAQGIQTQAQATAIGARAHLEQQQQQQQPLSGLLTNFHNPGTVVYKYLLSVS
ncbi:histone acetyltransferase p300-like [Aplochiton taeniatus]